MKKHKFYSAINMIGLSLAIGFIFLVFLFVKNELAYDQFHANRDSIYRVYNRTINIETGEVTNESAVTAIPLARDLHDELPAIKEFTRFGSASVTVRKNGRAYAESISYADPGFLHMFDFPMMSGDRASALDLPNAVILSMQSAKKYFGTDDPMNQVLELEIEDSTLNLVVTGIIDSKSNLSSLQFDLLIPFVQFNMTVPPVMMDSYNYSSVENYILMPGPQNNTEKEKMLTKAIQLYSQSNDTRMELGIQPMSKMHLESKIVGNAIYTNPRKVYILVGLALLILLVASINFITLSMGHAMNRVAEVGVRKTLGAMRGQLRRQFVVEALLITVISSLAGCLIAWAVLPFFNELVASSIQFSVGMEEIAFVIMLVIGIGMISGLSQSIMLVRQDVPHALKGRILGLGKKDKFTEGLVVFQFALSIVLIIGAFGMHTQLNYLRNTDLGFDQERLLEIAMNSSSDKDAAILLLSRFKARAIANQRILAVSGTMNNIREPWTNLMFEQENGTQESIYYNQIDPDYLKTMGIELLAGKDFTGNVKGSSNAILVNQALVDHFGWDDPVGQEIPGKNFGENPRIAGVFKDFHFSSLHNKIEPLILGLDENAVSSGITGLSTYVWPPNLYQIIVRFGPGDIESVIKHLRETWNTVNPDTEFVYHFVDEAIEAKYAEDKRWGRVTFLSSLFAIIIAWLGLLGLVRLTVDRKTKEIGIRKVLGSTTEEVIALLSKQFLILVLIGNLVAWPIAWWLLNSWLQSFDYRIALNPLLFLVSGLGVFLVVLSSVSLLSLKAAMANPVEAMRTD